MSDKDSELELEIRADKPSAIGRNGDTRGIAFNMDLIRAKNPALAKRIEETMEEVKNISPDDEPQGTEEDAARVMEMFDKLLLEDQSGR